MPAGKGTLTAAEPVVGGELQGALGAVPALPPELELALLHPAVRPGRHAAGVRQVSLAWETAGLKPTAFYHLSMKTDINGLRVLSLITRQDSEPICSGKSGSLGKSFLPFAKQNCSA